MKQRMLQNDTAQEAAGSRTLHTYCTHARATKLLCPHHKGAGSRHPITVGWPDLWYQMALVDTTVEQSFGLLCGRNQGT